MAYDERAVSHGHATRFLFILPARLFLLSPRLRCLFISQQVARLKFHFTKGIYRFLATNYFLKNTDMPPPFYISFGPPPRSNEPNADKVIFAGAYVAKMPIISMPKATQMTFHFDA